MSYDEKTAGGLMNTELIHINLNLNRKEAIDEIIRQSEEIEEFRVRNKILAFSIITHESA